MSRPLDTPDDKIAMLATKVNEALAVLAEAVFEKRPDKKGLAPEMARIIGEVDAFATVLSSPPLPAPKS